MRSGTSVGPAFPHPVAFWVGCACITAGVLAHLPMFLASAPMGYRMVGMEMDPVMLAGMAAIPLGLGLAWYGLVPRLAGARGADGGAPIHFHVADRSPLRLAHGTLVLALFVAVAVDVMKPATLGFVMPGMTDEYGITSHTAGTLALVALTGTAAGSIGWGRMADALGRRAAILLSALIFIGTAICGAMPTFEWNLAMCFLMGMSAGGLLPITFTLMAEMVPARHRGWLLVALGGLGTAAGYLLASGAAAVLEPIFSWRILWMLGLPTGMLVIVLNRFIPESPRFLASVGLRGEARAVLARYGGEVDPLGHAGVSSDGADEGKIDLASSRKLLRGPYARITVGLVGAGLAWGLVNFGFLLWLPTNLRELGMRAEAASTLLTWSGLLALPGVVAVVWLYHAWSSVRTLVAFIALTAASLLVFFVLALFELHTAASLVAATASLLVSVSGVISMLIPYAAETYPVHMRGTGAGVVAAASKAGGVVGAGLGVLGFFDALAWSALLLALPLAAFGALLLWSGIDTRGRRLEEIHAEVVRKAASG